MLLCGALLISIAGVAVLAARLWCYKRQISHLTRELEFLEETGTGLLLTSAWPVDKTERMVDAMNRILEKDRLETERLSSEIESYRQSLTGISHDIRTPLTSVKGYVQMLSNPKVTGQKREEYLKIIGGRLGDLEGLLDQLFEYTRIEAGEIRLETEKLNLSNLFAESVALFYEDFLEKGCEPKVTIPQEPCYVMADVHAMNRIVENLIKNALVHGVGDYGFSLSGEEGRVAIRIANRTESIEKQDMDRIFDRFYTTDQSRSRKTTGLGLAIVKELAERMGGRAEAFLAEGVFTVEVSFAQDRPGIRNT